MNKTLQKILATQAALYREAAQQQGPDALCYLSLADYLDGISSLKEIRAIAIALTLIAERLEDSNTDKLLYCNLVCFLTGILAGMSQLRTISPTQTHP